MYRVSLEFLIEESWSSVEMVKERWLLTTAQYNAKVNKNFLNSLESYAKDNDYKIGILMVKGAPYEKDEIINPLLQEHHIFTGNYKLNDNLYISDWKINPQQIKPLTGIRRFANKNGSTIFGSPKQMIEHLASNKDIPKLIGTTGAVTKPHYNLSTRVGQIAKEDHEYGAIAVDVIDNQKFLWRNITALNNGSFYDIKGRYDGKRIAKNPSADAIIMGDSHYTMIDKKAYLASLQMIKKFKPNNLIDHDIFEGSCITHHVEGNSTAKYFARNKGKNTLDAELKVIAKMMNEQYNLLPVGARYVVPQANHNEHISRWLDEGRYVFDELNLRLGVVAHQYRIDGHNPIEALLKYDYGLNPNVTFLGRNDDYKIRGYELARHGDLGDNGTRAGLNTWINKGKIVKAHGHSADKHNDVYTVGTRTKKRMSYNKGESSWSHSNGILFPDGKIQLVNMINGKWLI